MIEDSRDAKHLRTLLKQRNTRILDSDCATTAVILAYPLLGTARCTEIRENGRLEFLGEFEFRAGGSISRASVVFDRKGNTDTWLAFQSEVRRQRARRKLRLVFSPMESNRRGH